MSPKVFKPRKAKAPPIETPQPECYFEDGLRKVKLYYQTYLAHAKDAGSTVPDIFASETPTRSINQHVTFLLPQVCTVVLSHAPQ